jgi:hypothetical protein
MLAEIPLPLNELVIAGVPFPHLRWLENTHPKEAVFN